MQNPRNLRVYPMALQLATEVYSATADFPRSEQFGLTSQMRRAAVSVGSNISEGCGRRGDAELKNFLYYSMGSASELDFQLDLAELLHFGTPAALAHVMNTSEQMRKMLSRLIKTLEPK